ncbi:hypothetical protein BC830DRAFT_32351 [Chytriomyces sp. MP71]|nr:hypothetical protein BC830DRAFT_32351 [Chytriomyces sp. MP71]
MQILPSIAGLTELTLLSLRNGSIPGNLPTAFGSLTKLQYLDLGINKFQGSIPPQLGNLAALTFLSINNNALLDGNIPSELGNLKALQSLDLSQNALVGPVPTSITSLPALKTLYLQNNLLTGPQPTFAGTSNFIYNCFDGQKATELNSQCPASSSAALLPSGASKTPSSSGSSNNTVYNQDPSPPSASSGPPVAAIAGAVAGVLVAALIVAGIVIYKRRSTPTDNTIKVGGPPPPPNGYYHGENKYAYDSEYGPAASEDLKPLGAPPTTNSSTGSIMPPYAQSVSGSSSGYQTENTRNVAAYRVLPEKGGPALDEKSRDSKSGYGTNGGAVRDSFLDSQFSGSVRGSVQAPALDEKTMLRMVATEGSEKNANLFMQPGSGALASGSVDPTAWGVEQAAQWAAQIPGIGASVSAKIRGK